MKRIIVGLLVVALMACGKEHPSRNQQMIAAAESLMAPRVRQESLSARITAAQTAANALRLKLNPALRARMLKEYRAEWAWYSAPIPEEDKGKNPLVQARWWGFSDTEIISP